MTFPSSSDILGQIIVDADGPFTESYPVSATHQLGTGTGSGLPTLPTGWRLIPKGAFPINAPGAPTTLGTNSTNVAYGLAPASHYKWALTNVTLYGETTLGSVLDVANTGSGVTGYGLALPPWSQSTATNPAQKRRLYRTKAGGTSLFLVTEFDQQSESFYVDGLPDDALFTNPPVSNTSGSTGAVDVSFGLTHWTEVASSPATGQFAVDYSLTTGGLITHAAADAGKAVSVTFRAATMVNDALLQTLVTAIKDIRGVLGSTPQGTKTDLTTRLSTSIATLDGNGRVQQAPSAGVRQHLVALFGTVTATTGGANVGPAPALHLGGASSVHVSVSAQMQSQGSNPTEVLLQVIYSGTSAGTIFLPTFSVPADQTQNGLAHSKVSYNGKVGLGLAAGDYIFQAWLQAAGTAGPYALVTDGWLEVEEVAP